MEDTYKGQVDNPLSLNRYTYVHNNPIRYVDRDGHQISDPWGNGGINKDANDILRANSGKGNVYWEYYINASLDEIPEEIRLEIYGNAREPEWYEDPFTYVAGGVGVGRAALNSIARSGAKAVGRGIGNVPSTLLNADTKADALKSIVDLPSKVQSSTKSFFKGGSNAYTNFTVEQLPNGNYLARMTKPGNVPGSKAIYYKEISPDGTTVKVYKDTFDPKGNLVHTKDK